MSYLEIYRSVKANYTPEKRADEKISDYPGYLIYRPISFVITPFFISLRISANATTVLSIAVAIIQLPIACFGGDLAFIWISVNGVFFHILDCVDGNIARHNRKSSVVGQMLDSVASMTFWLCFMISAGILAHKSAFSDLGQQSFVLSLILGTIYLLHRELEDTMQMYLSSRVTLTPAPTTIAGKNDAYPSRRIEWGQIGKVLEHIWTVLILIAAGSTNNLDYYFLAIFVYQSSMFAFWIPRYISSLIRRSRQE